MREGFASFLPIGQAFLWDIRRVYACMHVIDASPCLHKAGLLSSLEE